MSDLPSLEGLGLGADGAVSLRGPALELLEALDRQFVALGSQLGAEAFLAAPVVPVGELRKLDYFASFPQLVLAPVGAAGGEPALAEFAARNAPEVGGPLQLGAVTAPDVVLAPAACYAVYPALRGLRLEQSSRCFSVRGYCFRREVAPEPLRRQQVFQMRELVHVGSAASAATFLAAAEAAVIDLAAALGLSVTVGVATDPFFAPERSSRFLHQKLFPTKREVSFEGLAIASLNLHRAYFGTAFDLAHGGAPACTACVAFGLERWLWALLRCHGPSQASWPERLR